MVHPDPQSTVALRLKEDTRVAHEALEARLLPFLEAITDADAYAHLLRAFYSFYGALETKIAAALPPDALPDLGARRKAGWLLEDLKTLGDTNLPGALPQRFLPTIDDEAAAWGALYVLEGSSLGGRLICRMIAKQFPGAPLRFFNGYGSDTGPLWVRFLAALEQAGSQLSYPEINRSATHTFQSFDLWLQQQLPVMSKAH